MQSSSFHDALKPISWLAGRWRSENGCGKFPNVEDFSYHEVLEFLSVGQPMLNFTSTSWHPVKRTPMHQERGFLRIKPGTNELAFVVSHNFGLTTIEEGVANLEKKEITLKSTSISRMSFTKPPRVTSLQRTYSLLPGGELEGVIFMETEGTPLTEHLRAVYTREVALFSLLKSLHTRKNKNGIHRAEFSWKAK